MRCYALRVYIYGRTEMRKAPTMNNLQFLGHRFKPESWADLAFRLECWRGEDLKNVLANLGVA